jgi:hypothetical protein
VRVLIIRVCGVFVRLGWLCGVRVPIYGWVRTGCGCVGVWVFVLECLVCVRSVNVCEYWPIYSVILV